jgi:hypothetical protein
LNRAQHSAKKIDLVPSLDDPKDLFGSLVGKPSHAQPRSEPRSARDWSVA